ncbi:Bifunctional ligase/repressor BirA [Serratia symbiotica]|nr:Bifunctional ligase/repressor BirA [Serratia symbiotica]
MSIDKSLLKLIVLLSDGRFYSMKYLSNLLGINQFMINKYINIIRGWGIIVLAISNKEYSFLNPIQLLEVNRILKFLKKKQIIVLSVVDSTNQYLLDRIYRLKLGDACISEYQKFGRGRRGRHWVSPFGTNLYLSMYWNFNCKLNSTVGLSLVVGIVIAEVLRHLGVQDIYVKWPNDLYFKNKKLAGILIELIGPISNLMHFVIGIGINLVMHHTHGKIINQDWINLQESGINIDRNELVAIILNKLRSSLKHFENYGFQPFIERWNLLDRYINKSVKVLIGKKQILGISRGIDQSGALLLDQRGIIKSFMGEEISLRKIE